MRINAQSIATVGFVGMATAQTMVDDANGDGLYSIDELRTVFPDLSEDTFVAMDTDADGGISAEELAVAEQAGLGSAG